MPMNTNVLFSIVIYVQDCYQWTALRWLLEIILKQLVCIGILKKYTI